MSPPPPPSGSSAAPAAAEPARWFSDEIHPHEDALRSYLRGSFPKVRDVDDVVQESYLRIFQAKATHPIRSARAFLFTIARRLAIDTLRHERAAPFDRSCAWDKVPVASDTPDAAEQAVRSERVRLLAAAIADLPGRCRDVFVMHKIKGCSREETAARLGLAEKTVEVQTANAMRRCGEYLRRRGVTGLFET